MPTPLPWLKLYVDEILSDPKIMLLSDKAFRCYIKLMCIQWKSGTLSTDLYKMAIMLGMSKADLESVWHELRPILSNYKPIADSDDERLLFPELDKQLAEAKNRSK